MTTLYVSSVDGNNADDGLSWTNAKQSIAGALAALAAGSHVILVDSAHSFIPNASITHNGPANSNTYIVSVNRTTEVYEAGALETLGTGAVSFNIGTTENTRLYYKGLTLGNGSTTSTGSFVLGGSIDGSNILLIFDDCILTQPNDDDQTLVIGTGNIGGQSAAVVKIINSELIIPNNSYASNAPILVRQCNLELNNVTISYFGATKPLRLFYFSANTYKVVKIIDSDLSGFNASGASYFNVAAADQGFIELINCKLSSVPDLILSTIPSVNFSITLVNVDSGDTHNTFQYYHRLGTLTESTSIYLNSGSEFDGTGISWEIVTSTFCSEYQPFITPWLHKWCDELLEIDASIELVADSASEITDRDCWAEFEYLGDSSSPKGTLVDTKNTDPFIGTGVNLSSSSETWTGTGGFSNEKKRKISETFTPVEKSLLRARLSLGLASKTIYIDPSLRIN